LTEDDFRRIRWVLMGGLGNTLLGYIGAMHTATCAEPFPRCCASNWELRQQNARALPVATTCQLPMYALCQHTPVAPTHYCAHATSSSFELQ
jgi:hypothetical protein